MFARSDQRVENKLFLVQRMVCSYQLRKVICGNFECWVILNTFT